MRTLTPFNRSAFTLIELLVVIGVLAIVVALAMPVLQRSRASALASASLSRVQQCGTSILTAAENNAQRYPIIAPKRGANGVPGKMVEIKTPSSTVTTHYFSQVTVWNYAVEALGGGRVEAAWRGDPREAFTGFPGPSDFYLAQSFMTEPDYWTPGAEQQAQQWRAVGLSEVVSPSAKAVLHDPHEGVSGSPIFFADGHGALKFLRDAAAGVPNSLEGNMNRPCVTTAYGTRGRDYP